VVERGRFEPSRPFISPSFRDLTGVSILWREVASGQKTRRFFRRVPSPPLCEGLRLKIVRKLRPRTAQSLRQDKPLDDWVHAATTALIPQETKLPDTGELQITRFVPLQLNGVASSCGWFLKARPTTGGAEIQRS
jgi:hypothetical protein